MFLNHKMIRISRLPITITTSYYRGHWDVIGLHHFRCVFSVYPNLERGRTTASRFDRIILRNMIRKNNMIVYCAKSFSCTCITFLYDPKSLRKTRANWLFNNLKNRFEYEPQKTQLSKHIWRQICLLFFVSYFYGFRNRRKTILFIINV